MPQEELLQDCVMQTQLKGVNALKLSYLYDGSDTSNRPLPPIELFIKNDYKQFQLDEVNEPMSADRINRVLYYNAFGNCSTGA